MSSLAPGTIPHTWQQRFTKNFLFTQQIHIEHPWTNSSDYCTKQERKKKKRAQRLMVGESLERGRLQRQHDLKRPMKETEKLIKQFLSLWQRKALGKSHFESCLPPGTCGYPRLQTHWCSQHFLWGSKTVQRSGSELREIQWDFLFHLATVYLDVAFYVVALTC